MNGVEVDAVVVGAGFGGMYMLHKLRGLGVSVQGFEVGDDVGGTWYWNRYPGARCDIPSLFYSYTWSDELQQEWRWSEKYAAQPEILRYANHVADRFDLRPLIAFETRVLSASFDDGADRWRIVTDRGDQVSARWLIMASGCLSTPRAPAIPGVDSFAGETWHTGAWPHEGVDFTGQRVAVIGTGSSGIQAIPQIAAQATQVTVFQRTPNFSIPARNTPLTDQDLETFRANYPAYMAMVKGPGLGFGGGSAELPAAPASWRPGATCSPASRSTTAPPASCATRSPRWSRIRKPPGGCSRSTTPSAPSASASISTITRPITARTSSW
jgi:cyclohexanone monooxygenase